MWELPFQSSSGKAKKVRGQLVTDRRHDWSEFKVLSKLEHVFPSGAFAILPQVRDTTGNTGIHVVDAVVASMWPSRGVWLGGVEIKITKSDWRKELRDVNKASVLQSFCKYWFVAAPSGVIPVGEVPEAWGLIEVREDGATIVKPAPPLDPAPLTVDFVVSLIRSTARAAGIESTAEG